MARNFETLEVPEDPSESVEVPRFDCPTVPNLPVVLYLDTVGAYVIEIWTWGQTSFLT